MERKKAQGLIRERLELEDHIANIEPAKANIDSSDEETREELRERRFLNLGTRLESLWDAQDDKTRHYGDHTKDIKIKFPETTSEAKDEVELTLYWEYQSDREESPDTIKSIRAFWTTFNIEPHRFCTEKLNKDYLDREEKNPDRLLSLLEESVDAMQNQIAHLHSAAYLKVS